MKSFLLSAILIIFLPLLSGGKNFDDNPIFFKEHLKKKSYDLDTSAGAIILYENAVYSIDKDIYNKYFIYGKVRKIVKILKKDALSKGDVSIFVSGSIKKITATTYLLEGDELIQKKMPDNAIKIDHAVKSAKSDNGLTAGKFSLPAVAEGCIIDYTYETSEDISTIIAAWDIQEDIPKLCSELTLNYPGFVKIALIGQNGIPFEEFDDNKLSDPEKTPLSYSTPSYSSRASYYTKKWVRKNIPAHFNEPLVYNFRNYTERLEIQIARMEYAERIGTTIFSYSNGITSWKDLSFSLSESKNSFGKLKNGGHKPAKNVLAQVPKSENKLEYARNIYKHIRDNFSIVDGGVLFTQRDLDWVLKNKSGSHIDFHLALISVLREADINAHPVILSTRDNLRLLEVHPILNRINHVVTRVKIDGEIYYLDPTEKNLPFGTLLPDCYSGFGWVVSDSGFSVQIEPQELKEKISVQVKTISSDSNSVVLGVRQVFGKVSGYDHREKWQKDSLDAKKELLQHIKESSYDARLLEYQIHNLTNPDTNLILQYSFKINLPKADNIIFVPSLYNHFTSNPFKSKTRYNPVEIPSALDVNYNLILKLPENYLAKDLPGSGIFKFDDNNFYKYLIDYDASSNTIMLNTKLNFQNTYFEKEDYEPLQQFFDKMIENQQKAFLLVKKI